MAQMTKRVNIRTYIPVRSFTPPIHGTYNNIIMSTGDILKCLCKRAIVDEILPDGSTVRLTMKNYYTDNGAGLDARKVMLPMLGVDEEDPFKVPEKPAPEVGGEDQVVETSPETDVHAPDVHVEPETEVHAPEAAPDVPVEHEATPEATPSVPVEHEGAVQESVGGEAEMPTEETVEAVAAEDKAQMKKSNTTGKKKNKK